MPPPGRRVAVGAEQRGAGPAEALQVDLVADAVARAREADAVVARDRTGGSGGRRRSRIPSGGCYGRYS